MFLYVLNILKIIIIYHFFKKNLTKQINSRMDFISGLLKHRERIKRKPRYANNLASHPMESTESIPQPKIVSNEKKNSSRVEGKPNKVKSSAKDFGINLSTKGSESTINQVVDFFNNLIKIVKVGDGIKTKKPKTKTKTKTPKPTKKPKTKSKK